MISKNLILKLIITFLLCTINVFAQLKFDTSLVIQPDLTTEKIIGVDFDFDGDNDLIASFKNKSIHLLSNNGDATFSTNGYFELDAVATRIIAVDLDKDDDMDIIAGFGTSAEYGEVRWFENDGKFEFVEHKISRMYVTSIKSIDLDSDNDMDIIVTMGRNQFNPGEIVWFRHEGALNFIADTLSELALRIFTTDIDNDTDIDIVCLNGNKIQWLENNGVNEFAIHLIDSLRGPDFYAMSIGDLDSDGDQDVVSYDASNPSTKMWHENDGSANFKKHILQKSKLGGPILTVDLDCDNDMDIVTSDFGRCIYLYINDGIENFTLQEIRVEPTVRLLALDLDTDEDIDIVTYDPRGPGIFWHENRLKPRIITPNGGETIPSGGYHTIKWKAFDKHHIKNVELRFRYKQSGFPMTIVDPTPNNGYYEWKFPSVTSSIGKISIHEYRGDQLDISDSVFALGPALITLTSPNGGESIVCSLNHRITWDKSILIENVNLEYSINNGTDWNSIALNTPDEGSYEWLVPKTPSSQCLIRILNSENDCELDRSDTTFAIVTGLITLTSPNGGETFYCDKTHEIKWKSIGEVRGVRIELSHDFGTNWKDIVLNTPDDGLYEWIVPYPPSNNCLIKIKDASDGNPIDMSDNAFIISDETAISNDIMEAKTFKGNFHIIPNPIDRNVFNKVTFYLTSPDLLETATGIIYDALGNILYELIFRKLNQSYLSTWNITDKDGRKISAGVYTVVLHIKNRDGTTEMVKKLIGVKH